MCSFFSNMTITCIYSSLQTICNACKLVGIFFSSYIWQLLTQIFFIFNEIFFPDNLILHIYECVGVHFRFNGSMLQVMGTTPQDDQWAILGGTGEFVAAEGIVEHKIVQVDSTGRIYEIKIHAFYIPMNSSAVSRIYISLK